MAKMPGAIWRPLAADWDRQPRIKAHDFFCIHTMVGSLVGTDGYFKAGNGTGYGGTESHFGVGADGTIWQWQDTAFQADANGNGNWHVISSENADTGFPFPAWSGSNVPALTPQQVEANARIAAWLWEAHRIPLDIAGSSKPGARGLAVHRYGVPGHMPAGAEQWSTAQGKACPGDRRVAQLPEISSRAKQIAGGAQQQPAQEDDMPLISHFIPAGGKHHFPIPPPQGGAAGWGRAWLSLLVDRHGADSLGAPSPTYVRIAVQGGDGKWRPAFGNDVNMPIRPGTRPVVELLKGDQAVVVAALDKEYGVGMLIEYARS